MQIKKSCRGPNFQIKPGRMKVTDTKENRRKRVEMYKMKRGCDRCGYNMHPSALAFDHLPGTEKHPEIKNFGKKKRGKNAGGFYNLYHPIFSVKLLVEEIRKCRLLCVRCHHEKTYADNPRAQVRPLVWKRPEYDVEGEGELVNLNVNML